MNKEAVEAFKRELKNYDFYKINLEGTLKLIAYNEYLLENVHGIDPQKEPNGSSGMIPWVETDTYHRIANELERLRNRRDLRIKQIEYIDNILDQLHPNIKKICIEIYKNNVPYAEIASELHVSVGGLHKEIEREIDEILQK